MVTAVRSTGGTGRLFAEARRQRVTPGVAHSSFPEGSGGPSETSGTTFRVVERSDRARPRLQRDGSRRPVLPCEWEEDSALPCHRTDNLEICPSVSTRLWAIPGLRSKGWTQQRVQILTKEGNGGTLRNPERDPAAPWPWPFWLKVLGLGAGSGVTKD